MAITHRALIALLLTSSALGLIAAPGAHAATAEAASTVSEVVVTGSALPTTLDAVAVPVSTINAESIAKSGVSSDVLEILRKDLPSFAGRSNSGSSNANNTNQNTAGGETVVVALQDQIHHAAHRVRAVDRR